MKGVYLSEEGKKEILDKITELEKHIENVIRVREIASDEKYDTYLEVEFKTKKNMLKEILASALVLPVYNNWEDVDFFPPDNESQTDKLLKLKNGVIIQSKQ
jgi:hypothetical protein